MKKTLLCASLATLMSSTSKSSISLKSRRGLMIVLSSPSGAGKTSLSRALLESNPELKLSISTTTRPKRPGEINGKDYFFVTLEIFNKLYNEGAFLEHAKVFNHFYGTPRHAVEETLTQGQDILFDIDWQGTQSLKKFVPKDLVTVFILPPSWQELERRLKTRAQDSDEIVKMRMSEALSEISHWKEYDYVLINDELKHTLASLQSILHAERLKRTRHPDLKVFVESIKNNF